jgi:meso-butanediol dehydrogenase/(S,S)-butanediol dehydrogenase/diacetyl reductase
MGKHVFITGSAVGIGRGIAEAFARDGGTIIGLDINTEENEITKSLVEAAGGTCHIFDCDVGDRAAVKDVFDQLDIDHLDLMVNNSAVFGDTTLTGGDYETQTRAFDIAMDACAMGAFYCTVAAVPLLEKGEGANIINVITDHVRPGHYLTGSMATGYDCAKFSLWRLTENWAVELESKGIRVNGLCFGATDTPMLREFSPKSVGTGMVVGDLVDAVNNVIDQGSNGDTGQCYEFGMGPTPRETSLKQIAAIKK